jgi:hypothetical protein
VATNRWRGDAAAVKRVVTLTVGGTPAGGDTISYTINGKQILYTLGVSDTAALAAAGLYALLAAAAQSIPEFAEVVWSYTTGDAFVTGTAATAGVPFTGTAADTGTTTLTEAETVASSGPSHVDLAANWSAGHVPQAAEDILADGGPDLLYGWENVSAAAYTSLRVKASFEGRIGLPYFNAAGYVEYRGRAWPVATAVPVTVGEGDGRGPARFNVNSGAALSLTVLKSQARSNAAVPVVNVYGCSSGTLSAVNSDVALAGDDDTTSATVTTATSGGGCTLTVGKGATVTTMNEDGGKVVAWGTITTHNQVDGTAVLYTAPTTIACDGGTVDVRFTGTVTTATFRGKKARCECANDPRARTFTDSTFTGGAVLSDPDKTLTETNAGTWDSASAAARVWPLKQFSLKRS